jgi:Ca2+-binding EF-hand superfamily protein
VAEQVAQLDATLKAKLATDFNSVRKAFLAIDDNHIGYISAESIARYLGATKQKNFDFTLLEILIKLHTKGLVTRLNYNDFCAWLGVSIEPTETFFFRHDSKKNP